MQQLQLINAGATRRLNRFACAARWSTTWKFAKFIFEIFFPDFFASACVFLCEIFAALPTVYCLTFYCCCFSVASKLLLVVFVVNHTFMCATVKIDFFTLLTVKYFVEMQWKRFGLPYATYWLFAVEKRHTTACVAYSFNGVCFRTKVVGFCGVFCMCVVCVLTL